MAKSVYKEKILEKLRILHAEEELLYSILREIRDSKTNDTEGESE